MSSLHLQLNLGLFDELLEKSHIIHLASEVIGSLVQPVFDQRSLVVKLLMKVVVAIVLVEFLLYLLLGVLDLGHEHLRIGFPCQ